MGWATTPGIRNAACVLTRSVSAHARPLRTPDSSTGNPQWVVADYVIKADGFDVPELKAMAGGDCLFESIGLDDDFRIICNEEGRLKALPICMGLHLTDGNVFPVFGPFAVLRERYSKKHGGSLRACGLDPEDIDIVRNKFPWVTM